MPARKPMALPSLTGIRGVAALWVVLFHIQNSAPAMGLSFLGALPIIKDGFRGVDLFFLLSGFILMHAHQNDFLTLERRTILRFAALRVIRVYPLSFIVLLLIVPIVVWLPEFVAWSRALSPAYFNNFSPLGFVQTALLANRWFMRDLGEWNGPVWTLSAEIVAYATFPVLAFLTARVKSEMICLVVGFGMLLSLTAFEVVHHSMTSNITGRLAIVRAMTCFPAGVALYRVGAFSLGAKSGRRWGPSVALASAVSLLFVLLIPLAAVLAPLCFAGIIMGVRFGEGLVNRVLTSRLAMFLGEISFALYLVHFVPLNLLLWSVERYRITPVHVVLSLGAYLAATIAVSFVLHQFIELPALCYGRRLVARQFEQRARSPALDRVDHGLIVPVPSREP